MWATINRRIKMDWEIVSDLQAPLTPRTSVSLTNVRTTLPIGLHGSLLEQRSDLSVVSLRVSDEWP
jgi:hypothetical protein